MEELHGICVFWHFLSKIGCQKYGASIPVVQRRTLSLSLSLFNVVFFSEETQKYSEPDSQTLEWRLKP